jgi:arylformamidase
MKIYDVTVPVSHQTPIYQGDPTVKVDLCHSIAAGDAANVSQICMGVHTATHVDAPNHFIEGGTRVHEIEIEKLVGKCRVIELGEDVMAVEPSHVAGLAGVERILFKTRNSAFWNTPEEGFRTDFTYISPAAAKVLADSGMKLVGIDYLSVEKFGSEDFATHITLLEKSVVIVEGLDLREVPAGDYEITCLPLKYIGGGGDGSPARTILRTLD